MRVFKWHPPATITDENGKEQDSNFQGTVDVEIPNYQERIALMQEMGFSEDKMDGLAAGSKLVALVEKQVKAVDLYYNRAGKSREPFKSIDDLGYSKEGAAIINAIGNVIVGGMPLGNALKSP